MSPPASLKGASSAPSGQETLDRRHPAVVPQYALHVTYGLGTD